MGVCLGQMHRASQDRLLSLVIRRLILNNLVDDYLKKRRELIPLVLLLLKLVEESSKRLRPALVHLDHLSLNIQ